MGALLTTLYISVVFGPGRARIRKKGNTSMEGGFVEITKNFIEIGSYSIAFLIVLGFLGGLTSGFIGSGGAFVLTPGMMSLGVPATVAVASNMCHKFPKAMVGSYKRNKYGQVDVKLGIILGLSAIAGVQIGIQIQELILRAWGEAGSNLYVSLAFVSILTIIGIYMLRDSRRESKSETGENTSRLAHKVQGIKLPPMISLKSGGAVSLWVTIPLGIATGLLAATIAVGGFIGVPGMIYFLGVTPLISSGTELVVAFIMGMAGTITWGLGGFVDIRMTLLILSGSLFGVQIGAIGTTYVKDSTIKWVMAVIMILVAISRGIEIPNYLHELNIFTLGESILSQLSLSSFVMMCIAMSTGGAIILGSMWYRKRALARISVEESQAQYLRAELEQL
jgi:uncharacterized membrane protein YfcA